MWLQDAMLTWPNGITMVDYDDEDAGEWFGG